MNYQKIYNQLISKGKSRILIDIGIERHHIIPRCVGGNNNKSNLVELTPEEHYLAHQLLVKIYPDSRKLLFAAIAMRRGRSGNKIYGWLRRKFSKSQSVYMTAQGPTKDKRWVSNATETLLVEKSVADNMIYSGEYISGKIASLALCGHLVRKRCMICEDRKTKSYVKKKDQAAIMAKDLFEQFKKSSAKSIGEFAVLIGTSQPRLSMLWKRYVDDYQKYVKHGKSLKKTLTIIT
jgi:hypothetical protein